LNPVPGEKGRGNTPAPGEVPVSYSYNFGVKKWSC
jgi:hypothetical protein